MPYQLLFADDSATMHRVVQITFAREDFNIIGVNSGPAAIAKAKEVKPDVAIIDISMPGMDGYAVCQALKNDPATAQIPVLLLAGSQEPYDETRAQASGANSHVVKPFETQALIDRVKTLVGAAPGPAAPRPVAVAAVNAPPAAVQARPPIAPAPPQKAVAPVAPVQATPPANTGWSIPAAGASPRPPGSAPIPPPARNTAPVAEPTPFAQPAAAPRTAVPLAPPITQVATPPARPAAPAPKPAAPALSHANESLPADSSALLATVKEMVEAVAWELVPDRFEAIIRERTEALVREHIERLKR